MNTNANINTIKQLCLNKLSTLPKVEAEKIDAITDSSSTFFFSSQDRVDTTLQIVKGTLQVRIIHTVIQIT